MFASLASGVVQLPGMTEKGTRYFRDLYDHLIRIADVVDSYRDLLSGVMDTHVSTVSNRLNVVMKQLTIIATIFLPLELPDRILRPELLVSHRPHHRTRAVLRVRVGHRSGGRIGAPLLLPKARLARRTLELRAGGP